MSYCPECGTDFPERNAPCAICGTPYAKGPEKAPRVLSPYASGAMLVAIVLVTGGLLLAWLRPGLVYDQNKFLKGPALTQIRADLAAGRVAQAREASLELESRMWWYSGIPTAAVAATYLQDHFAGKKGALEKAGEYARKGNSRETCHVSRYYLAIYHYEKNEFLEAGEHLSDAYTGLIRRRVLDGPNSKQDWLRNIRVLQAAVKESESHGKRLDLKAESWGFLL